MKTFDESPLVATLKGIPTRELAIEAARRFLGSRGWILVDRDGLDVVAVHPGGHRLLVKCWINPRKEPVPKFYLKNFDKAAQEFITTNNLKENVDVLFLTNAILDRDAHAYYSSVARFTMRVCFTSSDIKEQLARLHEAESSPKEFAQRQLLQYLSTA